MPQSDIAIVGVSCRYAGEATSPEKLHEMLLKGDDAWSKVPSSRFNIGAFHHPSRGRQGSTVRKVDVCLTSYQ